MKVRTLADMKFYLYRSKNKIDMLYHQLGEPDKSKRVKWKLDVKVMSRESDTEKNGDDLTEKLEKVVRRLDDEGQIGSIYEDLPYIRSALPVRWGLYDDAGMRNATTGVLVYFGHTSDDTLLGMAGSSFNVEGMYGITSTGSRSVTPHVVDFLLRGMECGERPEGYGNISGDRTQLMYEGIALANHYLRGPEQTVEFVAKVITRDQHCRLRPWREEFGLGVLATPLYVAQTDVRIVADDRYSDEIDKK